MGNESHNNGSGDSGLRTLKERDRQMHPNDFTLLATSHMLRKVLFIIIVHH